MSSRIVVSFHGQASSSPESMSGYLESARAIAKRAEALGGALCAWAGDTFGFEFAEDELEQALALALEHVHGDERLSVGIAQGELRAALERGNAMTWGPALVAAERLARLAHRGEVLLHPELEALAAGELLVNGRRVGRFGAGDVVRGKRLDLVQPLRRDALAKIGRLVAAPLLIGREEALVELDVPLGCVGLVRAARGAGGTRMLTELGRRLSHSRVLFVSPGFLPREPLGALRNALGRALSREAPPDLPDKLAESLDKLLAGDGIPTDTAADLVDAWLGPEEGRSGLLLVDDVELVDASTLEVIASAILPRGFFRAVVRTAAETSLPAALGSIPVASEVTLGPLSSQNAEDLVRGFCGGSLSSDMARRFARRGGGMPLGIREALAEALATGELRFVGDRVASRSRTSGRGKPRSAAALLEARMKWLSSGERAALVSLAMLGGDAPTELVDAISTLMEGPLARLAVVEQSLVAQGFTSSPEPGWIALSSRSIALVLLAGLDEGTRVLWHRMVGRTIERQVGPLGLAEPAHHAARAGDLGLAAKLAAEAARASVSAGLRTSAAALVADAKGFDPDVDVPELEPPPGEAGQTDISIMSMIESAMEEGGAVPASVRDREPIPEAKRSVAEAVAALGDDPEADEDPDVMAVRLSQLTKQALVEGDLETLEHLLVRLRVTGEHDALVERMSAFVALGRDAPGDALRKLRVAAEASTSAGARVRARLSYGIALASVGDVHGALLETLDALGRAREAKDARGEQATARFLAYLSAAMGQPHAASVWTKVAQASGESVRG